MPSEGDLGKRARFCGMHAPGKGGVGPDRTARFNVVVDNKKGNLRRHLLDFQSLLRSRQRADVFVADRTTQIAQASSPMDEARATAALMRSSNRARCS